MECARVPGPSAAARSAEGSGNGCTAGLQCLTPRQAPRAAVSGQGEGGTRPTKVAQSRGHTARGGRGSARMLSSRALRVAGLGRRRKHREPPHGAGGERWPGGRGAEARGRGPGVRALALGPGAAVAGVGRGGLLPAPVARALQVSARGARAWRGGRAHWRGGVPGSGGGGGARGAVEDPVESAGLSAVRCASPRPFLPLGTLELLSRWLRLRAGRSHGRNGSNVVLFE